MEILPIPGDLGYTYTEVRKPIKDLLRVSLGRVEDIPVEDRALCHQAQALLIEPFPVHNILIHDRRLQLLLRRQVEDLDCAPLGLESNDVTVPVHDSTIRIDRALDDFIVVLQVNDDNLRLVLLGELLPDTHEVV